MELARGVATRLMAPAGRSAFGGREQVVELEAPVAVMAELHDEGWLRPPRWPKPAYDGASLGPELSFEVLGVVADRAELVPLPGAALSIANAVAGWWGSHRWSVRGQSLVAHGRKGDLCLDNVSVAQLTALVESSCAELRCASWHWNAPNTSAITWTARGTRLTFALGSPVTVTYPLQVRTAAEQAVLRRFVTEPYDEHVVLIDAIQDPRAVIVGLGDDGDGDGTPLAEVLAQPALVGRLPRLLRLPKSRQSVASGTGSTP